MTAPLLPKTLITRVLPPAPLIVVEPAPAPLIVTAVWIMRGPLTTWYGEVLAGTTMVSPSAAAAVA
jgi:hypothetical protein